MDLKSIIISVVRWCDIGSVYGAPGDCLWGGGRVGYGDSDAGDVLEFMSEYGISARLTFSNSLLRLEHLADKRCNDLCRAFEKGDIQNGVIVHSELLLDYLQENYPGLYMVSSTTKVITDFDQFSAELDRDEFRYVVPDFRLNKAFDRLRALSQKQKDKVEFLCNECCTFFCQIVSLYESQLEIRNEFGLHNQYEYAKIYPL